MLRRMWHKLPEGIRQPVRRLLNRPENFYTMTPETPPAIRKALLRVRETALSGDYYEFGMYRGYTFWFARKTVTELGLNGMHLYGFDSFAGLPPPTGDDAATGEFKQGDYACGLKEFKRVLMRQKMDWSDTTLIPGFYNDSLRPELKKQYPMRPVAVALIDCDLYASTVPVLNFLSDLLQDGSILLFDDWNCFKASDQHGERLAFREFLERNKQWRAEPYISFGWHGQAFILRRN